MTVSLATLSAVAFGQSGNVANPGTLNYIEGQASIEGRPLSSQSVGNTTLQAGQTLATANGKAEILLTPGIFLRLGDDSTVQMVSTDLTRTEIKLEQGHANVEVDQIYPQNTILIDLKNGQTQLLKNGLYAFDAANATVRVFDGKAAVYSGANLQANVKPVDVKGGHQLVLNGEPIKPQGFNKDQASADPLYKWSSLRSNYLGEANLNLAEEYAGYSSFYPGWYWAGGPFGYTWLPGDGLFWSPFGYGFYSPYYIRGGGFIYGGYGRGFYGRGGYPVGGYRGGAVRAGGEGFHGGGGGFHGGGGGGGGHR
ncbi:MAG TPA: FecR domain-containing protein [Edaphobacter sp.]